MDLCARVKEWLDDGKFEEEFKLFAAVLLPKRFTREQMVACFEFFIPKMTAVAFINTGEEELTPEAVRGIVREKLERDPTSVTEESLEYLTRRDQLPAMALDDFVRRLQNVLWSARPPPP